MTFEEATKSGYDIMSIIGNKNTSGPHNGLFVHKYIYYSKLKGETDVVSMALRFNSKI